MTILTVYHSEPQWPATAQHPDAARYRAGNFWVDAIGGEPSLEDVERMVGARPSPIDVKAEAQRRIIALTGKSNLQDCMIKQFNALMRAGQLTDKRVNGEEFTADELREADLLRAMADKIKAIRVASDAIEALSPIPADYRDDSHWPE